MTNSLQLNNSIPEWVLQILNLCLHPRNKQALNVNGVSLSFHNEILRAETVGLQYFRPILDRIRYIGADISEAVDVAKTRMRDAVADVGFIQCDLTRLPLSQGSLDAIFLERVCILPIPHVAPSFPLRHY